MAGPHAPAGLAAEAIRERLRALAEAAGGWGLCKGKDGKGVFADTKDPDYQKILAALKKVIRRNEPGVKTLLAGKAR